MTFAEDFVRRAVAARKALGYSQLNLAQRMKVHGHKWYSVTVARTEDGARPVRLDEAASLAEILGIPLVTDNELADELWKAHRLLVDQEAAAKAAQLLIAKASAFDEIGSFRYVFSTLLKVIDDADAVNEDGGLGMNPDPDDADEDTSWTHGQFRFTPCICTPTGPPHQDGCGWATPDHGRQGGSA